MKKDKVPKRLRLLTYRGRWFFEIFSKVSIHSPIVIL